jgi:hypothetical protein
VLKYQTPPPGTSRSLLCARIRTPHLEIKDVISVMIIFLDVRFRTQCQYGRIVFGIVFIQTDVSLIRIHCADIFSVFGNNNISGRIQSLVLFVIAQNDAEADNAEAQATGLLPCASEARRSAGFT